MTIEESRKVFAAGWNLSAKLCDSCKSAASLVFCRADSAFLCVSCDAKIHGANKVASRHERVWMCEVCEQAPASVTCKADAAALCVTCDRDIHSANPLARRHERFPVVPFYESAATALKTNAVNFLVPDGINDSHHHHVGGGGGGGGNHEDEDDSVICREEAEAASWLLPNPNPNLSKLIEENPDLKSGLGGGEEADFFSSDVDPYLDLDYALKFQNGSGTDSVVPVQPDPHPTAPLLNPSSFDLDFSKPSSYSYTASLSQSVSSSSMEVGVVPDSTDITNQFMTCGGVDVSGAAAGVGSQPATQLTGLDREARVLRYREKRKNRKFEKTIRYASRKAYAETRPRIKGRFAKRTEIETEVDRLYSTAAGLMVDTAGYGVVPSF